MSNAQPYGYPAALTQTQVLVAPHRCSTAHVVLAWTGTVLTAGYLLPWAVAATRNRRNVAAVALVDLFLGWSLIGWVVALVMACGSDQPVVVVQTTYGPPPQQPWAPQPAVGPAHGGAPEPTRIDPLGTKPTQVLPRSPWEPDHRR